LQRLPVACVPTGVKHLHHAAERYDIGVYFEANGHGTGLVSPAFIKVLSTYQPRTPAQKTALAHLTQFTRLINQTVGDSLSDLLLVATILIHRGWGPAEWDASYFDLPNRLVKVLVRDRNAFTTTDAERKLVTPVGAQALIDEEVKKYEGGRAFVRPSGTERASRTSKVRIPSFLGKSRPLRHSDPDFSFPFIARRAGSSRRADCRGRRMTSCRQPSPVSHSSAAVLRLVVSESKGHGVMKKACPTQAGPTS
jgi:hypothetical protein